MKYSPKRSKEYSGKGNRFENKTDVTAVGKI